MIIEDYKEILYIDGLIKSTLGLENYSPYNMVVWNLAEIKTYGSEDEFGIFEYETDTPKFFQKLKNLLIEQYIKEENLKKDYLEHHQTKIRENIKQGNYIIEHVDIFKCLLEKSKNIYDYVRFLLDIEFILTEDEKIEKLIEKINSDQREINNDLCLQLVKEVYHVMSDFVQFALILPNPGSILWVTKPNFKAVKLDKGIYIIVGPDNPWSNPLFIKVNGKFVKQGCILNGTDEFHKNIISFLEREYLKSKIICLV